MSRYLEIQIAAEAQRSAIEVAGLREALEASGWKLRAAAARLGCSKGALQKAIDRNPGLRAEVKRRRLADALERPSRATQRAVRGSGQGQR